MARNNKIELYKSSASIVPSVDSFSEDDIRNHIYTIRGVQVMLDRDIALLYQVSTGRLNEAVKRNIERFPADFMFQLSDEETQKWKSQIAITNSIKMGLRHNPYVFTEQGVSQLASVLRSDVAVQASIRIQRAFVAMRNFLVQNAGVFQRLEQLEYHQLLTDNKVEDAHSRIDVLLNRLDDGSLKHKLGMFFDGQMFESFSLVEELVKRAKQRIVLIDDYVDGEVIERLRMRAGGVKVDIYVQKIHQTSAMKQAFEIYHRQYPNEHVELHTFDKSHDRWLIIDDEVYHFGASIKDLGKKWFSVNRVTEYTASNLLTRIEH